MSEQFELTVLPLHRRDGQDQPYLPGLLAVPSPRRAARGRSGERLVLQLTLPADSDISAEVQKRLLQDMANGYFRAPGAVTSALREQAERLNAYFLKKNQQAAAQQESLAPALLSMLSIKDGRATLAQCGHVQTFLLGVDIQHYYDPQIAGRGLGLSQATDIRFHQIEFSPGDVMLLFPELPSGWSEKTLQDVRGQKLDTLRRRFLGEAGPDLQAVLLAAQPGEGLRVVTGQEPEPRETVPAQARRRPAQTTTRNWEAIDTSEAADASGTDQGVQPEVTPVAAPDASDDFSPNLADTGPTQAAKAPKPTPELWKKVTGGVTEISQRFLPPVGRFILRLLPEEPIFNLPPRTMGLIAILVPLAVVLLVSIVYLQFGRGQLYVNYLERAQSAAAVAAAAKDPEAIRQAWEVVVFYAQRAVDYEKDAQTAAALLAQAQTALDDLDYIKRIDFAQALLEPLPSNVSVTRMAANNTGDVFMLNETDGSILHAFATGNAGPGGYQLDKEFHCEPGQYGEFIVSKLVDLAVFPREAPNDWVLAAIDANGNIIYCAKNAPPTLQVLTPPDSQWGKPKAMTVENGNLYILDPLTNAVWLYNGEDYSFAGAAPHFFFGAEVPNLKEMEDMGVSGDMLFLTNQDGKMAICEYGDDVENPTTCTDPAPYGDSRPGHHDGATIPDAHFSQIQLTDAPLESLFLLDPVARSVYQFNLSLNLQRQFRARTELPEGLITAFAVSPQQSIFIAIQNRIYFGYIPAE